MFCFQGRFKSSTWTEEIELEAELQNSQDGRDVRTLEPVDDNGFRPRERLHSAPQTRRGLKSRHVQLIALGGSIGTGLFVGSGTTLSLAGPAPLFMCEFPCAT